MPDRVLKIHEQAYKALKSKKRKNETFSDVILRLTQKNNAHRLLELMDELYSPDLADSIETTSEEFRNNFRISSQRFR
ncbi:MAG: antitoxin VapB family protein [Thermoproteota archaeon]|jgi:predicted CopG family antitoxin